MSAQGIRAAIAVVIWLFALGACDNARDVRGVGASLVWSMVALGLLLWRRER